MVNTLQITEVGKALLPYLRNDLTNLELASAAHDAACAISRTTSQSDTISYMKGIVKDLLEVAVDAENAFCILSQERMDDGSSEEGSQMWSNKQTKARAAIAKARGAK